MINKCRQDIIDGKQKKCGRIDYEYDNMYASIDRGLYRSKQEDSVLIANHPHNSQYKLLLVADGVGGSYHGDIASNRTALESLYWFENLPLYYFSNEEKIIKDYLAKLISINYYLPRYSETTVNTAVVSKNDTILFNVGDSRTYSIFQKRINQISYDHAPVADDYRDGYIKEKDLMRFYYNSNIISSAIGQLTSEKDIYANYIANDSYDYLFLCTDGVSDCLSEKQILELFIEDNDNQNIASKIVDKAITNDSYFKKLHPEYADLINDFLYHRVIPGGKDNTTAAVLKKIK